MFLQASKSSQHQCPLLDAQTLYIPASVERVVTLRGTNLPQPEVRYFLYVYSVYIHIYIYIYIYTDIRSLVVSFYIEYNCFLEKIFYCLSIYI